MLIELMRMFLFVWCGSASRRATEVVLVTMSMVLIVLMTFGIVVVLLAVMISLIQLGELVLLLSQCHFVRVWRSSLADVMQVVLVELSVQSGDSPRMLQPADLPLDERIQALPFFLSREAVREAPKDFSHRFD